MPPECWSPRSAPRSSRPDGRRPRAGPCPRRRPRDRDTAGARRGRCGSAQARGTHHAYRLRPLRRSVGRLNPLHYDEPLAQGVGFPSVFSIGMFQAGLLATYATDWLGADTVRRFSVRFKEQVWPGDVLVCAR
ncbi:MaoC/PaaZ C-terminal domain-containing protein [Dactylosporangium sucinum]|uniref:MaoC/PaaZ C-terminal domain-containing protein n=1 Tax=Dactylosporangium sucinum TaxID=1424081 RepID=UPI001E3969DE|nr:MaoC/PaaZ C-terminal domain-containing protein [Dactylosporangium sucinum]